MTPQSSSLPYVQGIIARGTITPEERIQASVFAALFKESDIDRIVASSQTSINEDDNFYGRSPSLQKNLPTAFGKVADTAAPIIQKLRELTKINSVADFDHKTFLVQSAAALDALFDYQTLSIRELNALLDVRTLDIEGNKNQAIFWTSLSLALSALLAATITYKILQRVKRLNATSKIIASGDLTARVGSQGNDELGELARSFDTMTDHMIELNAEIAKRNAELNDINKNLEGLIEERTATIKTILNNVKFGFLLVDPSLTVLNGYSQSCKDLLGSTFQAGLSYGEAFGLKGNRNEALYYAFLEQAFEDFLPEEMTLLQLPSRVRIGERILSIQPSIVRGADGSVTSILFSISDATNLEKAEKESNHHKMLVRLLKELDAFRSFVSDARECIGNLRRAVEGKQEGKIRAELHTLKGNSASFDLIDIAKLIHTIEDSLVVEKSAIDAIEMAFIAFLDTNFEVLGVVFEGDHDDTLTIKQDAIHGIRAKVLSITSTEDKLSAIDNWMSQLEFKPAKNLIGALPEYCTRLAARLHKELEIRIEGGDVKMEPRTMRPIMQGLVHLVRNAIDHGIENPDEREMAGKRLAGVISIHCTESFEGWTVEISDDGRGIDKDRIVAKALASGLIDSDKADAMSENDKLRLIFANGVSTAESVSDISGRGVGMDAVERTVVDAGGHLKVHSDLGKGTTVTIFVPRQTLRLKMAS